jgi:hypothetical protein
MHELRLHGCKDRLLLCAISPDNNDAILYIAVKYLKNSLHNTSDQTALERSLKTDIKINTETRHVESSTPIPSSVVAAAASTIIISPHRKDIIKRREPGEDLL